MVLPLQSDPEERFLYSYLWMPGGATSASVTNLSPGTYTVEVSDYVGCPDYTQLLFLISSFTCN
ncbi:MAG: hypothetical protein IPI10_19175 [Bacteroidetes bacterium]|nr:hypothetical protein [Bacteroidota bacterium]